MPVVAQQPQWTIALHGGAGKLEADMPAEKVAAYEQALGQALDRGAKMLVDGRAAVDVVEQVVVILEDEPLFNAGRGAVFDRAGGHSLDASIMDGSTLACGGVAGVTTLRNPIRGARLVMDRSPHVLMAAEGADKFCAEQGATTVTPNYFSTRHRFDQLLKKLRAGGLPTPAEPLHGWPEDLADQEEPIAREVGGTVGCVVLDTHGNLAAATSTGGWTAKMVGRVGDSPIPAAGNFANHMVAVSGTGQGEEYLRHFIAGRVAVLVESGDMSVDQAVKHCLSNVLEPGDGGLIAVDKHGNASLRTTTPAMPHGVADSTGRREVGLRLE